MNGIFMDIFEDSVSFVASDTHKLVRFKNQGLAPGVRGSVYTTEKTGQFVEGYTPEREWKGRVGF